MISKETVDLIRQAIRIDEIIGEFVSLKKRGANFIGLCPFHDEKTPSFIVSPSKDLYKCFGCGKSGNSISYLMEQEKMSYPEALKWLAEKYNIDVIENNEFHEENIAAKQKSDSLILLNKAAEDFFHNQLLAKGAGNVGKSYFTHRGFHQQTIEKFHLGYSPNNRNDLIQDLLTKQFNKDLILESGLGVERNGNFYDNYRNRVIFPIHDFRGKTIGFGARILSKNSSAPKYINTPQNEVYNKSFVLYGIFHSSDSIRKKDNCFIVEGYTDVLSLHQKGIQNVVSSSGTSLTLQQLKLIQRITNNVTLIFDSDSAGIAASERSIDLALTLGLNIQLILLPEKEDPDSFCKKHSLENIEAYFQANVKDFLLFLVERKLSPAKDNILKKSELVNQVAKTLSNLNPINDFVRKDEYIKKAAKLLDINPTSLNTLTQTLYEKNLKQSLQIRNKKVDVKTQALKEKKHEMLPADILIDKADEHTERELIKLIILHGLKKWDEQKDVFTFFLGEINEDETFFSNNTVHLLFKEYLQLYKTNKQPCLDDFKYHENAMIRNICLDPLSFKASENKQWDDYFKLYEIHKSEPDYIIDIKKNIVLLKIRKVQKLITKNQKDLQNSSDENEISSLLENDKMMKEFKKTIAKEYGFVVI